MKFEANIFILIFLIQTNTIAVSEVPSDSTIINAVKFAHSLETKLFANPESATSREYVFNFYRQGFSKDIAQRQTAYSWNEETKSLRPGDISMDSPDIVIVISKTPLEAIVVYYTPDVLKRIWGLGTYTVETLNYENGKWVVTKSEPINKKPAQLPERP